MVERLASDDRKAWGLAVTPQYVVYSRTGTVVGDSALVRVDRVTGASVELVSQRTAIRGVAVDGDDVYYAESIAGGGIWRVPLDGSGPPEVFATDQHNPMMVAVNSEAVYWTNYHAPNGGLVRGLK